MSEQAQGTATTTPGTQGNVPKGPANIGKTGTGSKPVGEIGGGHPKIQQALTPSAPKPPEGKDGAEETPKEVASTKFKLKVYGKERELDYTDPEHRAEIQRRLQMDVAAEQRLGQATEMQKKIDQLTRLANNPNATPQQRVQNVSQLLQAYGYDRNASLEVGKAFVADKIREEMMDPRELALMTERQKREAVEQQMRQNAEAQQKQYETQLQAQKAQKWEADILGALNETKDLPASPVTVRLMAQNLLDAKRNGIEMTPLEAAHATRGQISETINEFMGQMTVPQIAKMMGQEFIDKIRSHAIEELQAPLNQTFAKKPDAKPNLQQSQNRERKWKSWTEKQEELDRRVRT